MNLPTTRKSDLPAPFQAIVMQAPDAMIYTDREGAICAWNLAAEKLFGYTSAEVIGQSLDVIIPERFRRAHAAGFRQAVDSGQLRHAGRIMTTRATHKNGSKLYMDLSFGLIKNAAGSVVGVLAIARDCTERHRAAVAAPES